MNILGVNIDLENYNSIIEKISEHVEAKTHSAYVVLTNVYNIVLAQKNDHLKKIYNSAFLSLPDGLPLVWIARARGFRKIKSNIRGADFMRHFFHQTSGKGYKHFFYGGKEGIANTLKKNLEQLYPGTNIVGFYSPPFRELSESENRTICHQINSLSPDIVWVGLGTPKQELWMYKNMNELQTPILIAVGAAFDFLSGSVKEAPKWIQKIGMEWFFRLMTNPIRLWKRYFFGNTLFIYYLLKEKISK